MSAWQSCLKVKGTAAHFVDLLDGFASIDVNFVLVNFYREPYKSYKAIEKILCFIARKSLCIITFALFVRVFIGYTVIISSLPNITILLFI